MFVRVKVARVGAQFAAIEFDDARRNAVQECAIVRDDDGGRAVEQQALELRDAGDVEVVRRLVEQQQLGFESQGQRERCPLSI